MERNPKVGVQGCKIFNPDKSLQESVRRFPDLASQVLILLKLHNFFPNLNPLKKYFAKDFNYSREQSVDQVMGAFFMIRKQCLETVGQLDERFWIWFEEVDFCKRAKQKDWNVVYNPNFGIVHKKGQSFSKLKAVKEQYLFNRSLLYYFRKHHSFLELLVLLFFYPFSIFLAFLVEVIESFNESSKK
jgi:hypothetical protein